MCSDNDALGNLQNMSSFQEVLHFIESLANIKKEKVLLDQKIDAKNAPAKIFKL